MPDRARVIADNAQELTKLSSEAAGLVQQFFIECDRRGTLVQFSNAVPGGKTLDVHLVTGDPEKITLVARLLRMTLDGSTLEV